MRNYKDLQVWSKAHELTLAAYRETQRFPAEERFGLTSQIRRACVSIGANLTEGCGRRSDRELARYIQIALGSATELSYHILAARDLGLIVESSYNSLQAQASEVQRMLVALFDRIRTTHSSETSKARATATGAES